jgi:CheY-like chemotaxis protein
MASQMAATGPLARSIPATERPRILVAEDDADCAQAIEVMLRSAYDVYVAESGRELLHDIELQRPDLLVLDYQLPDTNGLRLIEAARRKQGCETRAIAMSAYSMRREACLRGGFSGFLHKPFGMLDLIWAVERALR